MISQIIDKIAEGLRAAVNVHAEIVPESSEIADFPECGDGNAGIRIGDVFNRLCCGVVVVICGECLDTRK